MVTGWSAKILGGGPGTQRRHFDMETINCRGSRGHAVGRGALAALLFTSLGLSISCGSSRQADRRAEAESPQRVEAPDGAPIVDLPGRVSVFLRVFNGDDTPAAGLQGSDFDIFENGELVSQSESFQRIRPQPQVFRSYLHLVLDRSNSVLSAPGNPDIDGARAFIETVTGAQTSNFVKISWFDGSSNLHAIPGYDIGFSNDKDTLLQALTALEGTTPFQVSTNLYGAVSQGLDDLDTINQIAADDGVKNRALAIVTFTDGTHQVGGPITLQSVVAKIQAGSTTGGTTNTPYSAFTIGVGEEIDPSVLVALGPNGSVSRDDFNLLAGAFVDVGGQVQRLANSFYFLSYCSPKTGDMNDLTISVRGTPLGSGNVELEFDATYFGAGCAFLDVRSHPDLGGGTARQVLTDIVDQEGGAVVAGWRSNGCDGPSCGQAASAFLARFKSSPLSALESDVADGLIDTDFGQAGFLDLSEGMQVSGATALVLDPTTGNLIVGGWVRPMIGQGPSMAAIWTVGVDGATVTRVDIPNATSEDEAITSLVRATNGDYYAGGFRGDGARQYAVWRLTPALALDTTFGAAGTALYPETPEFGNEGATDIVLGGNGRLYAVGKASGKIRVLALDRLSGQLAAGFGGTGVVEALSDFGSGDLESTPGEAKLDGQGRLVIGGTMKMSAPGIALRDQPAVWRILDSGLPDTSFAGSLSSPTFGTGVVTLRAGSTNNMNIDFGNATRIDALDIAPDGTLLCAGNRLNAFGHTDTAIFAFRENGEPLPGFNFVGFIIDDGAAGDDSVDAATLVHVMDSGAIWTLGTSYLSGGTDSASGPTIWVDRDPTRTY